MFTLAGLVHRGKKGYPVFIKVIPGDTREYKEEIYIYVLCV
jgi:hypothetical protein